MQDNIDPILMARVGPMDQKRRVALLELLREWCEQLDYLTRNPEQASLPSPHSDRFRFNPN